MVKQDHPNFRAINSSIFQYKVHIVLWSLIQLIFTLVGLSIRGWTCASILVRKRCPIRLLIHDLSAEQTGRVMFICNLLTNRIKSDSVKLYKRSVFDQIAGVRFFNDFYFRVHAYEGSNANSKYSCSRNPCILNPSPVKCLKDSPVIILTYITTRKPVAPCFDSLLRSNLQSSQPCIKPNRMLYCSSYPTLLATRSEGWYILKPNQAVVEPTAAPVKTSSPWFLKSKYLVPAIKIARPSGIYGKRSI